MNIFSKKSPDELDEDFSDGDTQNDVALQQEGRNDQLDEKVATPSKPSIISEGFEFIGTITTAGTLNISGVVKGKIHAKSVLVDTTGQVEGELHSDQVMIKGALNGEVRCQELNIGPKADVEGTVSYQNIHIQRGGRIKGQFTKK
jgi:cytoskeletal protein CcmA (bactofilin family)